MSFRTGPREQIQVSSSVKVVLFFSPSLLGENFVGKAQSDPRPPAFLPMLSHSAPRGRVWGICGSEWGCQDSEPALVPQCYPSVSISPENSSLYFVLSRRYRGRVHQSSSPLPRSPSVPQFPGVCVPCSLHRGSGVPRGLDFLTSFGPELLVFGKSYIFVLVSFPIPRTGCATEPRAHGGAPSRRAVAMMSNWPSH